MEKEHQEGNANFFAVVAPGIEDLALKEARLKAALLAQSLGEAFKIPEFTQTRGGLSFSTDLTSGYCLNFLLKIPTRILLRMGAFKSTDFSDLFKKVSKLEWSRYLRQGEIKIKVSTQSSRLKIKTRIEETIQDSLKEAQKKSPFRKSFLEVPQTLVVRIENDEVEISLDTSGEPLYKRGYDKWVGSAPIRETLASALYFQLIHSQEPIGFQKLTDPMSGSGTLLFEAADFFKVNRRRSFSFQNFPSFKGISFAQWPTELRRQEIKFEGFELSKDVVKIAEQNHQARRSNDFIEFKAADLHSLKLTEDFPIALILNPPYDERISADMTEISQSIERLFKTPAVKQLALVWPKSHWDKRPLKALKPKVHDTKNGGIEIGLLTYFK